MMNAQHSVEAFLSQPSFALVGVSRSGEKFGNVILRTLTEKGMRVYPLHPVLETVDGVPCYRHFADMPQPVGGAIVCVAPAEAVSVVRDAADAGIRHVWLQQGAESPYVANLCIELGLDAVIGECILMFANPTGVHRLHRTIESVLGRLPK
ncbi:MAG: CoA-binding protein [Vicinamibacterales bacterium]